MKAKTYVQKQQNILVVTMLRLSQHDMRDFVS